MEGGTFRPSPHTKRRPIRSFGPYSLADEVTTSLPIPIHPVRDGSPTDAVTTYFEQLARVPLLTREGEVDLARRIEDGERRALRAIVASPVGARELAGIGRSLRDKKTRLRDVTRATVDDETGDEDRVPSPSPTRSSERGTWLERDG